MTIDNSTIDEQIVEVANNKYIIRAYNPHGFYAISIEKGRLPDKLQGRYTSKNLAEADIHKYLDDKNRPITN